MLFVSSHVFHTKNNVLIYVFFLTGHMHDVLCFTLDHLQGYHAGGMY